MFSCSECEYRTPRKSSLNRHMRKRHNNVVPDHNIPPKIARHEPIPNIIDPTENEQFLQDIEQQEMQNMLDRNTQVGFGITQITPADESIIHEIRQFLEMNNLGAQTEIFVKFTSKTLVAFVILKPSTVVPVFSSYIYAMIVLHLLNPLPKPLKISFYVKPTLSRSTSLFHSFCNTERLGSSVTIMPATIINC